jgi:glycogen debranching enzyme
MFSGWGLRTLSTSMARYNPLSYHNGSVWPHDTAIAIAGLRRAGHVDEAMLLSSALLGAANASGGRLPELFAGIAVEEVPTPVPYPASCSPQAWASAAPLLVLRALLGLEPDLAHGTVSIDPVLPAGAKKLRVENLSLGRDRVTIEVDDGAVAVRGLPRNTALLRPAS